MLLQHPIEEETLPEYRSEDYYPVDIGEVFVGRYEVVGKLGYGSNSTSWLCRDREYVLLLPRILAASRDSPRREC